MDLLAKYHGAVGGGELVGNPRFGSCGGGPYQRMVCIQFHRVKTPPVGSFMKLDVGLYNSTPQTRAPTI